MVSRDLSRVAVNGTPRQRQEQSNQVPTTLQPGSCSSWGTVHSKASVFSAVHPWAEMQSPQVYVPTTPEFKKVSTAGTLRSVRFRLAGLGFSRPLHFVA